MQTVPLIVLSYSWLLQNHEDYSEEELNTALYWLGASWYDHIQYDDNPDAWAAEKNGKDPQARVKPFIQKAVWEGRYRHIITDNAFNEELAKLGLPGMHAGYISRTMLRAHLDKHGVRYADG